MGGDNVLIEAVWAGFREEAKRRTLALDAEIRKAAQAINSKNRGDFSSKTPGKTFFIPLKPSELEEVRREAFRGLIRDLESAAAPRSKL